MLFDLLQGDPLLRPPLQAPLNQVLNHHSWYFKNPDYGKVFFGFTVKQILFTSWNSIQFISAESGPAPSKLVPKKSRDPDYGKVFFLVFTVEQIFFTSWNSTQIMSALLHPFSKVQIKTLKKSFKGTVDGNEKLGGVPRVRWRKTRRTYLIGNLSAGSASQTCLYWSKRRELAMHCNPRWLDSTMKN